MDLFISQYIRLSISNQYYQKMGNLTLERNSLTRVEDDQTSKKALFDDYQPYEIPANDNLLALELMLDRAVDRIISINHKRLVDWKR